MASSSRFTLLPPNYLASQPPSSEITMQSLIDTQERLAQEAKQIMPYSFDECTYSKGYLRQSIWSCLDCQEKGVCYGCSISCHSDHRLVELWTKRRFKCDCPTISMFPESSYYSDLPSSSSHSMSSSTLPSSPKRKRHTCNLNPPERQLQLPNEENKYSHNFSGEFCRCGRSYDPETETEAMLTCIACEDWLHESCLNLRPTPVSTSEVVKQEVIPNPISVQSRLGSSMDSSATSDPNSSSSNSLPLRNTAISDEILETTAEEDEDDDEDLTVLIPSDSYDGLICASCVQSHALLRSKAGSKGWMMIEPLSQGGYHVVGKSISQDEAKTEAEPIKADADVKEESGSSGAKRLSDEEEPERRAKRVKIDQENPDDEKKQFERGLKWKGKGDVFLANGIRERLSKEIDAATISSLPFPLIDEVIYEPPQDEEEDETLDQVTDRVIGSLPRVQAIEALHGYQVMKERLTSMLSTHVQSGQTVSREDIEGLFAELREQKAR